MADDDWEDETDAELQQLLQNAEELGEDQRNNAPQDFIVQVSNVAARARQDAKIARESLAAVREEQKKFAESLAKARDDVSDLKVWPRVVTLTASGLLPILTLLSGLTIWLVQKQWDQLSDVKKEIAAVQTWRAVSEAQRAWTASNPSAESVCACECGDAGAAPPPKSPRLP